MYSRNLVILAFCQIFSFTAPIITVLLSGIIAYEMIEIKSFSTLPTALTIVGTAVSSIIASYIMSKRGRKFGFILASLVSTFASIVVSFAIYFNIFFIFCLAHLLIGFGVAFAAQYRFAAAESVLKDQIPKAISIILLGGIIAALIGLNLANYTKDLITDKLYVGSYLSLAALTFIPVIFLLFYKNNETNIEKSFLYGRSIVQLLINPRFLQAIIGAGIGYAIMSFLMTATPISMHIIDNFSIYKTGIVIQLHVLGMFLPSLFTGHLINKFGHSQIMYFGIIILILCIAINFINQTLYHYIFSLILLGVGWNFLFVSGTSLLVITYKSEEKFKAQGLNDFVVFSTQAIGSLSAGYLLYLTNWKTINLFCIPLLLMKFFITLKADYQSKKI